jgi:large exoprotein involved in heme utilization and adhesion
MAGPGTVQAASGAAKGAARGRVQLVAQRDLVQRTLVNTTGGGGGRIAIRGGQIELTGGSLVLADNTGPQDATGGIDIVGDTIRMEGGGWIASNTRAQGKAGTVMVTGRNIEVEGAISSDTFAQGNAGTVTINANNQLLVSSYTVPVNGAPFRVPSFIDSEARLNSSGNAGTVTITGRNIEMRNGAEIGSSTFGSGNAGTVTIQADRLSLYGPVTYVRTEATKGAESGNIIINTGTLVLDNGSFITTNVDFERFIIQWYPSFSIRRNTSIETKNAGDIIINTGSIFLDNSSFISTENLGSGNSGNIKINVIDDSFINNAIIDSNSFAGGGGQIEIEAGNLLYLNNSRIVSSVAGLSTEKNAGDLTLASRLLVLDDGSRIEAKANLARGGNVQITADALLRSPDSVIDASSRVGLSGTITIAAPNTDVSSGMVVLPETFFDASTHLRETCAARGGRPASSFNAGGRGGMPPDPGAPLASSLFGQPLEQQTATLSPTHPTPTVKPITVAGIPQPVLGSPRLTCRG